MHDGAIRVGGRRSLTRVAGVGGGNSRSALRDRGRDRVGSQNCRGGSSGGSDRGDGRGGKAGRRETSWNIGNDSTCDSVREVVDEGVVAGGRGVDREDHAINCTVIGLTTVEPERRRLGYARGK